VAGRDHLWDAHCAELSGIAKTAIGVAYVRAWESSQVDRLFADPYALAFVTAQHREASTPAVSALAAHVVLRTRFFDEYLMEAGCEQVVLVAAGLDTRAYRLAWPTGLTLFELDQPAVLTFKQAVLDRERAVPACDRRAVAVDLRLDWADALTEAGVLLRCGIAKRGRPAPSLGLDRASEFRERCGYSLGGRYADGEFVVSAAEVLYEGVPGDDHLCGSICSESAHGSEPVFELAVIGFDRVVSMPFDVVPR